MYNVTSFQLPAVESNGLVHGGQIFILQLCLSIKIKLVILVLLSFFLLITRPFYNMFPINKTNNSLFVFEFGLPVNFPKSVEGLYFFRLYTTPMSDKIEETIFSNWLSGIPHEKINRCLTDINRCLTDTENQFYKILVVSVKYRLYRLNIGLLKFLP